MRHLLLLVLACACINADNLSGFQAIRPGRVSPYCDEATVLGSSCRAAKPYECANTTSCWATPVNCTSVVDCNGDGKPDGACPCEGGRFDCATRSCVSPGACHLAAPAPACKDPAFPMRCFATADCWSEPVDCDSVVDCDGDWVPDGACGCGERYDCASGSCVR